MDTCNRCKTCQHWQRDSRDEAGWGTCSAESDLHYSTEECGIHYGVLHCNAEFGCIKYLRNQEIWEANLDSIVAVFREATGDTFDGKEDPEFVTWLIERQAQRCAESNTPPDTLHGNAMEDWKNLLRRYADNDQRMQRIFKQLRESWDMAKTIPVRPRDQWLGLEDSELKSATHIAKQLTELKGK